MIVALTAWRAVSRLAPALVAGILIAALLVQRHTIVVRTGERDAATASVTEFRQLVTDATVPADVKGKRALLSTPDARAALVASIRDRDDARASLTRIGQATAAAKARDVAADAALVREQAANTREFAAARPRIEALATARPAPTPDADASAIEVDSKAAWEAWR